MGSWKFHGDTNFDVERPIRPPQPCDIQPIHRLQAFESLRRPSRTRSNHPITLPASMSVSAAEIGRIENLSYATRTLQLSSSEPTCAVSGSTNWNDITHHVSGREMVRQVRITLHPAPPSTPRGVVEVSPKRRLGNPRRLRDARIPEQGHN
jgi:hypothetical protein